MELSISQVLSVIKKKLAIIAVCAALAAFASFTYTHFFITPLYTSTATLYVQSNNKRETSDVISSSDYSVSIGLVATIKELIQNRACLEVLANQTGLGEIYNYDQFRHMISIVDNNTESFHLSVSCSNPEHSYRIVNALANIISNATFKDGIVINASDNDPGRGYIKKILQAGTVTLIDEANGVPIHPSSPNVAKNVILGLLAGAILSIIFFVISDNFNNKILSEEDVFSVCENIPVLGSVPVIPNPKKEGHFNA